MYIENIQTSLKGRCESKHCYFGSKHSWIYNYLTFLDLGNRGWNIRISIRYHAGSFLHKAKIWQDRFEEPNINPGPKAYAAQQSSQWSCMASDADQLFRSANSDYTSLIT